MSLYFGYLIVFCSSLFLTNFLGERFPLLCTWICVGAWVPSPGVGPWVGGPVCLWCQQMGRVDWMDLGAGNQSGFIGYRVFAASDWSEWNRVLATGAGPGFRGLCVWWQCLERVWSLWAYECWQRSTQTSEWSDEVKWWGSQGVCVTLRGSPQEQLAVKGSR